MELSKEKKIYLSKMCSCCGHIKTTLKLSERIFECENCGLVIDRDLNAAINLANYSPTLKVRGSQAFGVLNSSSVRKKRGTMKDEVNIVQCTSSLNLQL